MAYVCGVGVITGVWGCLVVAGLVVRMLLECCCGFGFALCCYVLVWLIV